MHLDPSFFQLHPIDLIIALITFFLGSLSGFGRQTVGITLFLRVALIVAQMARHYMKTHPHGKQIAKTDIDERLNHLYQNDLSRYDRSIEQKILEQKGAEG